MLNLKEMQNRVYCENKCIRFEYLLKGDSEKDNRIITFMRYVTKEPKVWFIRMVIDRTEYRDSQVYTFSIEMPKDEMPLTLICETGLRFIQMIMKEEVQKKSLLDIAIGEVTR